MIETLIKFELRVLTMLIVRVVFLFLLFIRKYDESGIYKGNTYMF